MSKKRKTRKQKKTANLRHSEELYNLHIHQETPTYSITTLKTEKKPSEKEVPLTKESYQQKDIAYLKHDITAITAASGIILAFDILLFTALSSGILRLHFLGY